MTESIPYHSAACKGVRKEKRGQVCGQSAAGKVKGEKGLNLIATFCDSEQPGLVTPIPHMIIDDFLPNDEHRALLAYVNNVGDFAPGKTLIDGRMGYYPQLRKGQLSDDGLGPHRHVFLFALQKNFPKICAALGMEPFALAKIETRLAAHYDGDYFKPHSDVLTGKSRNPNAPIRRITAVYYLHNDPKGFDGGALRLHAFGKEAPVCIEPVNNRLAIFPSMLIHEVLPVSVPSGRFSDARFSISCWFDQQLAGPNNDLRM